MAQATLAGYKLAKGVKVEIRTTGHNRADIELVRSGVALSLVVVEQKGDKKTPIRGANVTLKGESKPRGLTDDDGRQKVTGLSAGEFTVEVAKKGYKSASIKVSVSNTDLSREIVLAPDATLAPKSFDLTIVAKANGKTLADADVTVKRTGKLVASGKSGESGAFTAKGLDPGFYHVEATKTGFKPNNKSVTLYKNDGVEIALTPNKTPPKSFDLTIVAKLNAKAAQGAEVAVLHGNKTVASGTTGATGSFTAKGLAAGEYTVEVREKKGQPLHTKLVTLAKNESVDINIAMNPTAKAFDLTIVVKADAKAVKGAEVEVLHGDKKVASGTTGATGSYTAKGLAAGDYIVEVREKGFTPASIKVNISDKNVTRDIPLTPLKKAVGFEPAITATDAPVPGIELVSLAGCRRNCDCHAVHRPKD